MAVPHRDQSLPERAPRHGAPSAATDPLSWIRAPEPTRRSEPTWFEPYPDALLEDLPDTSPGPEARYETREALALAFVAGFQRLPPRRRASCPRARTGSPRSATTSGIR